MGIASPVSGAESGAKAGPKFRPPVGVGRTASIRARLRKYGLWLWVAPALILVGVFVYLPAFWNIYLSLFKWSAFQPTPIWAGLDNYSQMISDPDVPTALRNCVLYAIVSVVFQVFGGLALAAILEEVIPARARGFFRTVYFLPAVISVTVTALIFEFIYDGQIGLLNTLLNAVGFTSLTHAWTGEAGTAIWAVIMMSQWMSVGFMMVLFTVTMQKIPREIYEAAYIDGATKLRAFFSITAPLCRDMTVLGSIITISGSFLVFGEVQVLTNGGPDNASQVLGTLLYRAGFFNDQMGYAAAIATFIFVITIGMSLIQLWMNRGKTVQY